MGSQNLHRPGLTTPYGLRRAKVGFGSPSGPVLNTLSLFPAKIFVTEKRETVIQNLSYNLCFVDPSFGFASIVLPSSDLFMSWIS